MKQATGAIATVAALRNNFAVGNGLQLPLKRG
jgi:hypothetical protein